MLACSLSRRRLQLPEIARKLVQGFRIESVGHEEMGLGTGGDEGESKARGAILVLSRCRRWHRHGVR